MTSHTHYLCFLTFLCSCCCHYRLDILERQEQVYAAKQTTLAQVPAAAPIGVTPAIMAKIEKQIQEGPNETLTHKEYFWNRKNLFSSAKLEQGSVHSHHALDTPTSNRGPGANSSFNLDTPASINSTEMMEVDDDGSIEEFN